MTEKKLTKVLISAGGTGGHIFPALAITKELEKENIIVEWIGTADRMEATIAPKNNIPISFIEVSGVVSRGLGAYLKAPFKVTKATFQALKVLKRFQPDVIITMGGYVVGPVGLAAYIKGIPLIIHEQNSVMGLTNKILKHLATKTLTAFPLPGIKKENVVGQPLREEFNNLNPEENLLTLQEKVNAEYQLLVNFYQERVLNSDDKDYNNLKVINSEVQEALEGKYSAKNFNSLYRNLTNNDKENFNKLSFKNNPPKLLSVGGSLGAKVLNDNLLPTLKLLADKGCYFDVLQQSGKGNSEALKAKAEELGVKNYRVEDFIDDMISAYKEADLIICRSGAITVFEIAAVNRMPIFVPFPGHKDQQQLKNAHYLSDNDAAIIIEQPHFNQEFLAKNLLALNYHSLYQRAYKQSNLSSPQAKEKIIQIAKELMLNSKKK